MSCTGIRRDVTISRELLLACWDSVEGDFLTSVSLLRLSEGRKPWGSQSNYRNVNLKRLGFLCCVQTTLSKGHQKINHLGNLVIEEQAWILHSLLSLAGCPVTQAVGISLCHMRVNRIERNVIVPWWLTAPELLCVNPHTTPLDYLAAI